MGRFRFVLEVRDSGPGPALARGTYEIEVLDPGGFEIATEALPVGQVGQGYDAIISTRGGRPPYAWAIIEGSVPEGIVVQQDDRLVELRFAGQADQVTTSNLLVEVVDAQGRTASRAFALRIVEAGPEPVPAESGCACLGQSQRGRPGLFGGLLLGMGLFVLRARRRRATPVD